MLTTKAMLTKGAMMANKLDTEATESGHRSGAVLSPASDERLSSPLWS
jgi:hypothetical protein